MDRLSAALTGERTTLRFGIVFWTALSKRKPKALSAAATSTGGDGGAACVGEAANTAAARNIASTPCVQCIAVNRYSMSAAYRTGTRQLIDQTHSGRATPTGHESIGGDGFEAAAA